MRVETAAEQLMFSTMRIQTDTNIGTGAIVTHKWAGDKEGVFLVTNKHVVAGTTAGRLTFALSQGDNSDQHPRLGETHTVSFSDGAWEWTGHPSEKIDITVLPLGPALNLLSEHNISVYYRSIPTDSIPDEETLATFEVVEEVVFVGYPNGMFDPVHNLPIFRKGIIATHPSIDYGGEPRYLIDASVFPGSSGSPVFLHRAGPWREIDGRFRQARQFHFLGILGQVFWQSDDGQLSFEEVPAAMKAVVTTRQMIDLGVVHKAKCVIETIEHLLRQRGEMPAGSPGGQNSA